MLKGKSKAEKERNNDKKIISLSLVLVMTLALVVVPASAAGTQYLIDNFETGSVGTISTTVGEGTTNTVILYRV